MKEENTVFIFLSIQQWTSRSCSNMIMMNCIIIHNSGSKILYLSSRVKQQSKNCSLTYIPHPNDLISFSSAYSGKKIEKTELSTFASYTSCKLNVFRHNRNSLGMNCTEICVFKQSH